MAPSGTPFTGYVRERILDPLGIEPGELGYTIANPARHAAGYLERWSWLNLAKRFLIDPELIGASSGRWVEIRPHYVDGPSFGGLVGTARAFGRFLSDQLRPRSALLGSEARGLFYRQERSASGPIAMTLGWHIGSDRGATYLFKEGGGGGFHGMMRLYPERGIGGVVLSNATAFNAGAYLDAADTQIVV